MAVWYGITKRLFDFVSPMRRERGCYWFTRCISLLVDGSDCSMCCTLAISSVLSKVCVVCGKEHKRAILQERWHIQPLALLCVLHYSIGKACFHDEGTAVGRIVTLCIEEIHKFLVSCVVMDGQGQSQYLGVFPSLLRPESSTLVTRLVRDLPLGFETKYQVLAQG